MEETLVQKDSDGLKIVVYGPESTGKTTLAIQLAKHFNTQWVPEFARDYLQEKYDNCSEACEQKDLIPIAKGQIASENRLAKKANKVLFVDTNVLQTYTYAKVYYEGFTSKVFEEIIKAHQYDLYLLTYIDTPWEEDDLRDKPEEREYMYEIFEASLKDNQQPYEVLKGTKQQRLQKAIAIVENLLKEYGK
ncbi:ATP-binding protein [Mesonia ostreae]|uniref:ATP-binding protein n=1 Tax=Mesonia ostreae TaxID=861110 RepID=A0ABU2KKS4_9FLAO|nr:ATP-binding protein [Mesonia ostreae]MDT0295254.1 ATP-binding protein [Mesonia ostreae]